jgi:hypothetical protein
MSNPGVVDVARRSLEQISPARLERSAMKTLYVLGLLAIAVVPASADIYSNGPVNGTIGGYFIDLGYSVSDSFVLSSAGTVTSVDFGAWTLQGYTFTSVQWSVGTAPGDNSLGSGVAATTDTFFRTDFFSDGSFTVDSDRFSTGSISLGAGTYYLTLQNAGTNEISGLVSEVGWDVNNGPSAAFQNAADCPPPPAAAYCSVAPGSPAHNNAYGAGTNSESFDIRGTTTAVTPEPGSYAALILGFGGVMVVRSRRAKQRQ